jgi:hypothetical protein
MEDRMKKLLVFSLFTATFLVAGCTSFCMVKQDTKPEIKPTADKATLVIYRSTSVGFTAVVDNFIDTTYLGSTKGKCYFVAQAQPGSHYLIAVSENKVSAKISLEAGKVYYILQGMAFGSTSLTGTSPDEFGKQLPELPYLILDPAQTSLPVLSSEEFTKKVNDYTKESAKDPERFKDMDNLKGY